MDFTVSMSSLLEVFAENIRLFREKKKISQEQLAEIANIHRTNISAIERGKRNVTLNLVEKLAQALEVDPYTLLKKN